MGKFTVIGDPHATKKNPDKINTLFDIVEEKQLPAIWLGDFFDTKEVIRGTCLNLVYNRLKESKLEHIILVGNHDWFNLDCQDHALQVLKELPNVTVVDKPMILHGMWFVPYMHDVEQLRALFKDVNDRVTQSVIFGHFDIANFDYGNGFMCETGLTDDDFKKFDVVISGHFHKYQQRKNITYLGTPFSHSFGESNQDKYIGVFDSETYNLELIPTPFPRHLTFDIDCRTIMESEFQETHDFCRVILNGTSEQILRYKSNTNIPENFKIIERPTDEFMNNVSIDETADNLVKFKEWGTEIKGLDPDTINLGVQILEAVK